jgi:predicted PurR-regulated permease PerM
MRGRRNDFAPTANCCAAGSGRRRHAPCTRQPPINTPASAPPARDPFVRRVATVLGLVALTAAVAAVAVIGIGVLLATFAGVLIAVVLSAFADAIADRTPLAYGWALTVVVLLILALLGGAGWLLGAQVAAQAQEFGRMLPGLIADIEAWLRQHGWGQWLIEQVQGDGGVEPGAAGGAAAGDAGGGGGTGGLAASAAGNGMAAGLAAVAWLTDVATYALVAVFVGLFGAANPRLYTDGIVSLTPLHHRERMRELLGELGYTLRWWLVGQAFAMIVIGVSTTIVLLLFGIPLALVLGLIVGLLGFIPYLGPIIGLVPVALVAGTEGATTLLWVLVAYTAVQMLEGYVATPMIHQRTVYLPPVFTIVMQVLLGVVLGIKGIVLATPLAAIVLVLSRFYRRDVLGEADVEVHQAHG